MKKSPKIHFLNPKVKIRTIEKKIENSLKLQQTLINSGEQSLFFHFDRNLCPSDCKKSIKILRKNLFNFSLLNAQDAAKELRILTVLKF